MKKLWLLIFDIRSQVSNGFAIVSADNPNTAQTIFIHQGSMYSYGYRIYSITDIGKSPYNTNIILHEGITSQGEKGEPFKYSDFTQEQLESLKGPKGDKGDTGEQGIQGPQGEQGIQGIQGDNGLDGKDGVTFIPSLDSLGNLSWTNNGNLDNPISINIKGDTGLKGDTGDIGPRGYTFTPTVSENGDITWTNDGSLPNPVKVNIMGPQGPKGDTGSQGIQGIQGEKGDSYVITENDYTTIAEIVKNQINIEIDDDGNIYSVTQ